MVLGVKGSHCMGSVAWHKQHGGPAAHLRVTVKTVGWLAVVVPARMPAAALAATATVCGTVMLRVTAWAEPLAALIEGAGGVPSTTAGEWVEVLVPVAVVAVTVTV